MRNFIVVFFCLVSVCCLGQKEVKVAIEPINYEKLSKSELSKLYSNMFGHKLELPLDGVYNDSLKEFKTDSLLIIRNSMTINTYDHGVSNYEKFVSNFFYNFAETAVLTFLKPMLFSKKKIKGKEIIPYFYLEEEDSLKINFSKTDFKHIVFFDGNEFQNPIYFNYAIFNKLVFFENNTFEKESNFLKAIFSKKTTFENNVFNKELNFSNTVFGGKITFKNSNFADNVLFTDTQFNYFANFEKAKGNGKLLFIKTQMPNIIDFTNVTELNIDLRNVLIDSLQKRYYPKFEKSIRLAMYDVYETYKYDRRVELDSIKYMSEYKTHFPLFNQSKNLNKSIILLAGANINNIILPHDRFWVDVTGYTYEEKTALYEKLIKKCKEEGMDESVIGWSTELKKIENLHNFPTIGFFLNWFQGVFWNYGYTKSLILVWILGAFLLFNILNFFIYPALIRVYFNPKLGLKLISKPLTQDAEAVIEVLEKNPYTRLRYMLHYTGMIFFGIKLEHTDMSFKSLRWVFVLYFQFVTGIILLGFALSFVVSK